MLEVIDNTKQSQYDVLMDGRVVGFATYRRDAGRVLLPHAEVRPEVGGQGVGSALAKGALDDVRRQGLRAVPSCSFILDYVRRHPEYQDLIGE